MVPDTGDQQAPAADAVLESHTHQDGLRSEPAGEERRDRRSRDRYGRDRRERGDRPAREETPLAANDAPIVAADEAATMERTPRYPTGFVTEEAQGSPQQPAAQGAPLHPAPEAAPPAQVAVQRPAVAQAPRETAAQATAAAAPASGLPKVQPFELPVADLAQVAEGSGLQWVNSDAQKIAAVQAAIAAEPKPVRVPRERPPAIVIDEGPLVLVETRRDLRDMKLPFEQGTLPLQ